MRLQTDIKYMHMHIHTQCETGGGDVYRKNLQRRFA